MLHFTIKIKVIFTNVRVTDRVERDVEMNDITVEEREEKERKVSQKYKIARVTNGQK